MSGLVENLQVQFALQNMAYSKYPAIDSYDWGEQWLYDMSVKHNLIKNQIKVCDVHNDKPCYTMKVVGKGNVYFAHIDQEDYDKIKEYTWYAKLYTNKATKYVHGTINKKDTRLSRFLCPDEWKMIDHINQDGLDNRKSNLREVDNKLNASNQRKRKDNTTGVSETPMYWIAYYTDENGKRHRCSRSKAKYWNNEARRQVLEWRKTNKPEYNTNGEPVDDK